MKTAILIPSALLLFISTARHCLWLMEQPEGSKDTIYRHPRMDYMSNAILWAFWLNALLLKHCTFWFFRRTCSWSNSAALVRGLVWFSGSLPAHLKAQDQGKLSMETKQAKAKVKTTRPLSIII